ncbi:NUDIX domain-containing protein [Mycoplasmatota bacterium]|nr:NUDIX domain-containing protein [Mycoplasmatota bacterium]
MEFFDLYDASGKKINKLMKRGSSNLPGEYHKVVHIWILSSKGEYLIQQRNKSTDKYPYQWAPTAGAVKAGETPLKAAIRETKEEIGLSLKDEELRHLDSIYIDHEKANFIIEMYLVYKDVDIKDLVIQEKEVKDVRLANKNEIIELLEDKMFWDFRTLDPSLNYFKKLEKRT